MKSIKEYIDFPILPLIASIIGFLLFFVPYDWYIYKAVSIIIFNLIVFRHEIKDFYLKHKKDDEHLKK